MIVVSVPGKVHLMGEHAVVYGKPALLAAVNMRLTVSVKRDKTSANGSNIRIDAPEGHEYIRYAVEIVKKHFGIESHPSMTISVRSQIPPGYHLGSSAAVAVATVAAVSFTMKKVWNPELFNRLAFEVEKKQHGNPSGGDNTAVTFGGFLWYRKELDFLKSLWKLPFKLPKAFNNFYLVDTGRPKESTGEMVTFVKEKGKRKKAKFEKLFHKNEEQVRRIARAIKAENEKDFIDAIQRGERTLEGMGVVSRYVLPFIREVETNGGAVKILGGGGRAGGVGFLLGYSRSEDEIMRIAKKYTYAVRPITLGEEGVRLEEK